MTNTDMTTATETGNPELPVDEGYERWASLTNADLLHMALDEAWARYARLKAKNVPNRPILFTCVQATEGSGDPIMGERWLRGSLKTTDERYDNYAKGKQVTAVYMGADSHKATANPTVLAYLNHPERLAERQGLVALDWRGAVHRKAEYRRESDGVTLRVQVSAGSSGAQGAVDEVVSAAAADEYAMLWLLRAKARDMLGLPAYA